jgi:Zn-dependent membrane protease YugP
MYGYYGYYMDPTYILVLIGAILCIAASGRLNSTYNKYEKIRSKSGMTGAEAAARILSYSGIHDVRIERVSGNLTDHYDPKNKVLRLSDRTYGSTSIAALGVAAHECGHAVQHQEEYIPIRFRNALAPIANISSTLSIPLILLGVILGMYSSLVQVGIWVFAIAILFQIVTLPVEYNASSRALVMLQDYGITGGEETASCKKVLSAAALTYVAGVAASLLQLLRLLLLFGNRRSDD